MHQQRQAAGIDAAVHVRLCRSARLQRCGEFCGGRIG
jgi:hypothetical protein